MPVWVDVAALSELEPGDATTFRIGKHKVTVYDAVDGLYATASRCTHAGAELCDGYFEDHVIECPLHQGAFDIRDGRALYAPAIKPLRTYRVRVVAGRLEVDMS